MDGRNYVRGDLSVEMVPSSVTPETRKLIDFSVPNAVIALIMFKTLYFLVVTSLSLIHI